MRGDLPLFLVLAAFAAVVAIFVAWSSLLQDRGIPDRLADTYLVPR